MSGKPKHRKKNEKSKQFVSLLLASGGGVLLIIQIIELILILDFWVDLEENLDGDLVGILYWPIAKSFGLIFLSFSILLFGLSKPK